MVRDESKVDMRREDTCRDVSNVTSVSQVRDATADTRRKEVWSRLRQDPWKGPSSNLSIR